jgi:glycosyltransferase involved in cell wall biosynthesis
MGSEKDRIAHPSNASAPEISVIIPTRNRRALLAETLASALAQESVSLEVIIVDDGSTDDTQAYLASIGDARVRVLRQDPRRGVSAARNRGVRAARGEWVAFLDDDDLWLPERLRTLIDIAIDSDAEFAYNDVKVINEKGRKLELAKAPPPEDLEAQLWRTGTITGPSAVIARRELVTRMDGFDLGLDYLADWDLWLRFAAVAPAAHCPRPLTAYRQHPGSMLMDRDVDIDREITRIYHRHPEVHLERLSLSRWVARRHREEGRRLKASKLYLKEARQFRDPGSLLRAGVVLLGEGPMRLGRQVRRFLIRRGVM